MHIVAIDGIQDAGATEYRAMATLNHRRQTRNVANFRLERQRRLARLKELPVGTEVSYMWDDISLGKVTKHDLANARAETDKGGSHNPCELKVYSPK